MIHGDLGDTGHIGRGYLQCLVHPVQFKAPLIAARRQAKWSTSKLTEFDIPIWMTGTDPFLISEKQSCNQRRGL